MHIGTLCWFFFWCTVINYLILGGMTAAFVLLGDSKLPCISSWEFTRYWSWYSASFPGSRFLLRVS